MNYEELKKEITQIYKDYSRDYAYGFINGMIYASIGYIDFEQAHELNNINLKIYVSDLDLS